MAWSGELMKVVSQYNSVKKKLSIAERGLNYNLLGELYKTRLSLETQILSLEKAGHANN